MFEQLLLGVSQIEPAAWEPIRAELQGIALLQAEYDLKIGGRPFLRFHPTLAIASADSCLREQLETRQRFVGVYGSLMLRLNDALFGPKSFAALEVLRREESNYHTAVRWALAGGYHEAVASLGNTFREYLEKSGRIRERDAWVEWLRHVVAHVGFSEQAASYEMHHAWTLLTQGKHQNAVERLQALVHRLRQTTEFDPAPSLSLAVGELGKVLLHCGELALAIPQLREGVRLCEALVERIGGQPWEKLLATPDHARAVNELNNLTATMGDLCQALLSAGLHDEALAIAKKGLLIHQMRGDPNVAASLGIHARVLWELGRYDEADAQYELAIAAAREAGDVKLEGPLLQHQGLLARERNQLDRATRLFQQALRQFQDAGNTEGVMSIYNNFGLVERKAGRFAEARAWYEKSRELAGQLQDRSCLSNTAQNLSVVCLMEGEAARKCGDEPAARQHFEAARRFVEESLPIRQALNNKPDEAASWGQLAQIHLRLGDIDAAERHAHTAREIHESLGLKEAWEDYDTLSEIAQARGDSQAAAEWAQKRDDLLAELERRAGGGRGLSAQMLKALQQLAIACAQAGFGGDDLDPGAEETLAKLDGYPAPFPDFVAHLRQLAAGQLPPIPDSLPAELRQFLEPLAQAIREAQAS